MKRKLNIIKCAGCMRDIESPLKEGEIDFCPECLEDNISQREVCEWEFLDIARNEW